MPAKTVKYVAEVAPVREVCLAGAADLRYWQEQLSGQGIYPTEVAGQARLLIGATATRYKGVPFREFTISVCVCREENGATNDGVFLVQAYNSSRLLAWCERVFFSTPYDHAQIVLEERAPASLQLARSGEVALRAAMSSSGAARPALRSGPEEWCLAIYLPGGERRAVEQRNVFFARLRGETQAYAFTPDDLFSVHPIPATAALRHLVESGFAADEWMVRTAAVHARSKTFKRGAAGV